MKKITKLRGVEIQFEDVDNDEFIQDMTRAIDIAWSKIQRSTSNKNKRSILERDIKSFVSGVQWKEEDWNEWLDQYFPER